MPVKIDGTGYIGTANNIYTDANGRVGIGTSAPAGTLNVVSDNFPWRGQLSLQTSTANNYAQITLYDRTNMGFRIYQDYYNGTNKVYMSNDLASTIELAGRITMPNQPTFFAFAGSSQAASNVVQFTTTLVNVGSYYNTTTYRFTAPVAGNYGFNAFALKDNTNTDTTLQFRKNGTVVGNTADGTGSAYLNLAMNIVLPLAIGDYVDVLLGVGGIYNGYRGFSGWLIG